MGQSIKEWTKQNLWKAALKKFEGMWHIQRFSEDLRGCRSETLAGMG